ncbi:MAG: hypothetical protein KIT14_08005 [bacterium]|nr:hypothetical protein [bacterium]
MTHLVRVLWTTVALAAATGLAHSAPFGPAAQPTPDQPADARLAQADGWERGGGGFKDSPYDGEAANDTEAGTQARESDAAVTTDKPASAEPFENPADIPDDEDED